MGDCENFTHLSSTVLLITVIYIRANPGAEELKIAQTKGESDSAIPRIVGQHLSDEVGGVYCAVGNATDSTPVEDRLNLQQPCQVYYLAVIVSVC